MNFKDAVAQLAERAEELVQGAAMLDNKNLSDVLDLGAKRFRQALQHADIDKVDAAVDKAAGQGAMFDPAAGNQGGNAQ
jgi:hypothetical protein